MNILHLATEEGEIAIREAELRLITDAELKQFGITRKELDSVFERGKQLMQDVKIGDRMRPVASQTLDGKWEVRLVRYSEATDPLLQGRASGTA